MPGIDAPARRRSFLLTTAPTALVFGVVASAGAVSVPALAQGVKSRPIGLPRTSVIVPAACLLAPTQSVSLEKLQRIRSQRWWF